jgi:filamentous hemagglutinin family protein
MNKKTGSPHARKSAVQSAAVQSGFHLRPKVAALAVAACFSSAALANPTSPTVVHGTASFSQSGNILNVTNSHNAIINWGSFSIGVNELTKFIQPSALSAVLNRVVGQDPSAILGALQSNGRVFLLNPNGIVFGAGSQINVAGLVASTLNLSNADFLAGRMNFTDGAGAGSVLNQGAINATGGPVYMVGNAVTNNGIITSPGGEIVLAAGNSVELVNPGTPNLRVEIQADNNEARNLGTVVADAGRIGIYAGLIKQSGVINANSAVSEGGRIMLKSTKRTDLEAGSVTSARGTSGGEIIALSGMTDGVTTVAGTLDASASATAGDGGFIETSAAKVKVMDGSTTTASGSVGGKAGTWLIDPADYYIASGGDISGFQLGLNLDAGPTGTNVTIHSDLGSGTGYGGTIFVDEAVSWNSGGSLTLIARNEVLVNSSITNAGTGDIKLYGGWDGNSISAPVVGSGGNIEIGAAVSTGGNIHLIAGGLISQDINASLTASGLLAVSNAGSVQLSGAVNTVDIIAGRSAREFYFFNGQDLTVGTVGGVSGITAENNTNDPVTVSLHAEGVGPLNLLVNKDIRATAGDGANAAIYLNANGTGGGNITVTNATVSAKGGDRPDNAGGLALVDFYAANGNITITGSTIEAKAGHGVYSGSGANVVLEAFEGDINISGGSVVRAIGGNGEWGGSGEVELSAAYQLAIAGSTIAATGGNGSAYNGGDGNINLVSEEDGGGGISISASQILASGGTGSGGYSDGDASIDLKTYSGSIDITGGSALTATGFSAYTTIDAYVGPVTLANSSVHSAAKPGADGGEGNVTIYASGGVLDAGSGTIRATGNPNFGDYGYGPQGNEIYLYGPGGVILGYMEADRYVSVSSSNGAIVDGNNGLNILAPKIYMQGYAGVGSIDNPIETLTSLLSVSSQTGDIGVINTGNLWLNGYHAVFAPEGHVAIGASGSITVDGAEGSAGGDFSLLANGDINFTGYYGSMYADGNLLLNAGGNLNFGGAGANNIDVYGNANTIAIAGGNLNLLAGDYSGSSPSTLGTYSSNTIVKTGGNVVVSNSSILGGPDVTMQVGGSVFVNGTMSLPGRIEAASLDTIRLEFTGPSTSFFSVNGNAGSVYDALTNTGFFTNGSPAQPGSTMVVTYTGTPVLTSTLNSSIQKPIDTLIVAMNQTTKTADDQQSTGAMESSDDNKNKDKKKNLPVCGK